jgi:hypothetical protein
MQERDSMFPATMLQCLSLCVLNSSESMRVSEGGITMRIGIVSDTHDNRRHVMQAIEIFRRHAVQYVLHAGDIVAPFTTLAFAELRSAKFIAVFGNNDG